MQHGCAVERARHDRVFVYVRRRRANLFNAVRAAIDRADGKTIGVGVLRALRYFTDDNPRYVFAEIGQFFHLEPAREKFFLQFLGGNVNIRIIF